MASEKQLIKQLAALQRKKWKIVDATNRDILLTYHPDYGHGLWARCSLRKEKQGGECALCGKPCGSVGFRPVKNVSYRYLRICHRHNPS